MSLCEQVQEGNTQEEKKQQWSELNYISLIK